MIPVLSAAQQPQSYLQFKHGYLVISLTSKQFRRIVRPLSSSITGRGGYQWLLRLFLVQQYWTWKENADEVERWGEWGRFSTMSMK
jgi:hypothetical protein